MLPEYERNRLLNQFCSSFPKLEIELTNALTSIDLLDKSKVEEILKIFNDILLHLQLDFKNRILSIKLENEQVVCPNIESPHKREQSDLNNESSLNSMEVIAFDINCVFDNALTTLPVSFPQPWSIFLPSLLISITIVIMIGYFCGGKWGCIYTSIFSLIYFIWSVFRNYIMSRSRRGRIKRNILDYWRFYIIPSLENWARTEIDSLDSIDK